MKRFVLIVVAFVVAVAGLACVPGVAPSPTPQFIPLPTPQGTDQQGRRGSMTPGAGGYPSPSGTPRAGGGYPQGAGRTAVPTSTVATEPEFVLPEPTKIPAPTPTSVAAQFLATPTPVPPPPAPAPRVSLQGRLVYQAASGGDINVINLDGTGLRTIAHGLDPAWSPDGKQIAFTKWEDGAGVYVINADGTGERRIFELHDAKSPTWSPDGSIVLVTTRDSKTLQFRWGRSSFSVDKDIWQLVGIRVSNSELVQIPVDGEYYAFSPTWSSQGFIVYRGSRGLYKTTLDGQAAVVGNTPRPDSPIWSPDGNKLAFMMWQNDHWDIFVMKPDGSGIAVLTPPPPFLTRVPNNVAPAWSPDGKYIAFLSDREGLDSWHIYVMNADGSDQRKLLDVSVTYQAASERVLSLSWTR